MWYTLVRFKDEPQYLKGVAQAKTAADALNLTQTWEQEFPDETTVVFDPKNAPVSHKGLVELAARDGAANPSLTGSH